MRFTVEWDPDVQKEYIELWLASASEVRQRLTKASDVIDRELSRHPDQVGQPLPIDPDFRLWVLPDFTKRVAVIYRIFELDRRVRIVRITLQL